MSLEQIFSLSGSLALIGWIMLCFGPRRWSGINAIPRFGIPLALSFIYAAFILAYFSQSGGGYGSLADVRRLLSMDELLLAGWIHYLAFDLMIGSYLAERMDRAGIQRSVQVPILIATFLFGPIGLILSFITERIVRRVSTRVTEVRP